MLNFQLEKKKKKKEKKKKALPGPRTTVIAALAKFNLLIILKVNQAKSEQIKQRVNK